MLIFIRSTVWNSNNDNINTEHLSVKINAGSLHWCGQTSFEIKMINDMTVWLFNCYISIASECLFYFDLISDNFHCEGLLTSVHSETTEISLLLAVVAVLVVFFSTRCGGLIQGIAATIPALLCNKEPTQGRNSSQH